MHPLCPLRAHYHLFTPLAGVILVVWCVVGFSLAFGETSHGYIGNPSTYVMLRQVNGDTDSVLSPTVPLAVYCMFQAKFAVITPALVTGTQQWSAEGVQGCLVVAATARLCEGFAVLVPPSGVAARTYHDDAAA